MRAGFTLIETLVALAVLAIVGAALVGLQVASLRAQRTASAVHAHAAILRDELVLQRVVPTAASGPCLAQKLAPDVSCEVERTCVATPLGPCAVVGVAIRVSTVGGPELVGRSAVTMWLEGQP